MAEELEPTGEHADIKRYPWSVWLDNRPHRLVWGEDFDVDPHDMKAYIYAVARKRGLKATALIEPTDNIVMQTYAEGSRRPSLPSPWRRLANGRRDPSAGTTDRLITPQPHDPERACRRCGARLTPASITAGECRKFSDPTYRCTERKNT